MKTHQTEASKLREKLAWVRECKCERPLCLAERNNNTHDQSKVGCPDCDFAHSNSLLFKNSEVIELLNLRTVTMTDQTEASEELYGDIIGMISQYFYEGWRYRVEDMKEPYEVVRKECNVKAEIILNKFITHQRQQLLSDIRDRVIGEEESADIKMGDIYYNSGRVNARNQLRTQQNQALDKLMNGGNR